MRFALILLGMIIAVIFAVQNAAPVSVTVFFWQLEASLAIIVAICFALGAIIAGLMLMPAMFRRRSNERRLQARIADLEATRLKPAERAQATPPPMHAPPPAVTRGA